MRYIPGRFVARPVFRGTGWQLSTSEAYFLGEIGPALPRIVQSCVPPTVQLLAAAGNAFRHAGELMEADPLELALMCENTFLPALIDGARYARSRLAIEAAAGRSLSPGHAVLHKRLNVILSHRHDD